MSTARKVLNRPVLVLTRGYQALMVVTVGRAFTMILKGVAEPVNHKDPLSYETYSWEDWSAQRPEHDDLTVSTSRMQILAPEVIRLTEYDKSPRRGVTCSRLNIFKRDRYSCQYRCCPNPQPGVRELTLDHVIPRTQGGTNGWENLVTCCYDCNQRKGGRSPKQAGMELRKPPVKPEWKPLYAEAEREIKSWSKFVSDVFWRVPLSE